VSQVHTLEVRQKGRDPYQTEDVYVMLYVNDSSVTLSENVKKVGTTKNGKTWVRFEPREKTIIRLAEYRDGRPRINVYRVQSAHAPGGHYGQDRRHPRKYTFDMTPNTAVKTYTRFSEHHSVLAGEFIKLYEERYGTTGLLPMMSSVGKLAYPILRDNDKWLYQRPLGSALRQATGRAFVESAFGKTRYRKDLMKAIAESYWLEPVAMAHDFRGLVPVDWLVDFIREAPKHPFDLPYHQHEATDLRHIARLTDQRSVRRLMSGLLAPGNTKMLVQDAIRSMKSIKDRGAEAQPLGRVDSWRQVHDDLALQARRAVNPNKPIPQNHKIVKALDGLILEHEQAGTFKIEHAKTTDDMENWGAMMGHCIGSYTNYAVAEHGFFFAIYRQGELYANLEMSNQGSIRQLYGRFNQRVAESKWLEGEIRKVVPEKHPHITNRAVMYPLPVQEA
jgi:hypothetical protein